MNKLTAKELAVITLLASGLAPKQIRSKLHLTTSGYTHRRTSVLNKLGAANDTQLGVLIERYQLVPVSA